MASVDDSTNDFKERLQNQANAFEGLYALTPAREYYGSQIEDGLDPSEQWNRKKQTKEQKRAAKKAKLDPANSKTALDIQKEREGKRKRELAIDDDSNQVEPTERDSGASTNKRQKQELDDEGSEVKRREKAEKRKEARERKKEKKNHKRAKVEARKTAKKAAKTEVEEQGLEDEKSDADSEEENDEDDENDLTEHSATDLAKIDFSGLGASDDEDGENDDDAAEPSSASSTPIINSPAFDVSTNHSEVSSSTSIDSHPVNDHSNPTLKTNSSSRKPHNAATTQQPSSTASTASKPINESSGDMSPKLKIPKIDQAELQERLRRRIAELRAQRNADGSEGKAPKSRQELLDQRRKKEEQRKAHKKELRRQAKEDEARQREEQLRGSGSPLSMTMFSPRSPQETPANNFSFTRLAFADGTMADSSLTRLSDPKKQKGPQDPQTALLAAEKKASRLAGLDEQKRAEIAEKDSWLHARQRTHGERVARDDTSLLKKALKRKEKQKGKSEREWKDREQAVVKGKEARQKKRETNLAKRKEEKGGGKKKKPMTAKGGKKKKVGRAGFEGSRLK